MSLTEPVECKEHCLSGHYGMLSWTACSSARPFRPRPCAQLCIRDMPDTATSYTHSMHLCLSQAPTNLIPLKIMNRSCVGEQPPPRKAHGLLMPDAHYSNGPSCRRRQVNPNNLSQTFHVRERSVVTLRESRAVFTVRPYAVFLCGQYISHRSYAVQSQPAKRNEARTICEER